MLSSNRIKAFQKKIYIHYDSHGRKLPWRKNVNPYRVLISEIMLQQTQAERVIGKYQRFLAAFPDFSALAHAGKAELLAIWSGLGYNRRALALRSLGEVVMKEHNGRLPRKREMLLDLPGIGKYTAGAVMAFAFNMPVVFMDTNIRRVYIHEFFQDRTGIHDDELVPLVDRTLDRKNPRRWYNALMDYGAKLKQEQVNPNRRSLHYVRQSPFQNSNRQMRGRIVKVLVAQSPLTAAQLIKKTGMEPDRVRQNLAVLEKEGFIVKEGRVFRI